MGPTVGFQPEITAGVNWKEEMEKTGIPRSLRQQRPTKIQPWKEIQQGIEMVICANYVYRVYRQFRSRIEIGRLTQVLDFLRNILKKGPLHP